MRVIPPGKYTVEVEEISPKDHQNPQYIHEYWHPEGDADDMIEVIYADGDLDRVDFHQDGFLQRNDGPARIVLYGDGSGIFEEWWLLRGARHRTDGPAVTRYYSREPGDGEAQAVERVEYRLNDELDRRNGPAVIEYDTSGRATRHEFWRNGTKVTPYPTSDEDPSI